jgi:hypothetical protein
MQATSKLRSLRKLKSRDKLQPTSASASSPTMHAPSRQNIPNPVLTKRSHRVRAPSQSSDGASDAPSAQASTSKMKWRSNSSAEIPIPSFMIPCSAGSLMNMRYALTSDVPTPSSSFVTSYPQAISQR